MSKLKNVYATKYPWANVYIFKNYFYFGKIKKEFNEMTDDKDSHIIL